MEINVDNKAIGNIKSVSNGETFGLKSTSSPYALPFNFEDYYDDRSVRNFITSVKKLIRTSREYNTYIENLRTNVYALNKDSIQSNITNADVDLEFHHYPLTLDEIVEVLMLQHINNMEKFTSFSIAKEVMEYHNKHLIGLVSLIKTNHELMHEGELFISEKQIFGNYKKFLELNPDGVTLEIKNEIAQLEDLSKKNLPCDFNRFLDME